MKKKRPQKIKGNLPIISPWSRWNVAYITGHPSRHNCKTSPTTLYFKYGGRGCTERLERLEHCPNPKASETALRAVFIPRRSNDISYLQMYGRHNSPTTFSKISPREVFEMHRQLPSKYIGH